MEHVVFYTGLDSTSQFCRLSSLDEAVRFVESLRNGEGVDDSAVFAMTEIPLRFQTYYRVELPTDVESAPPSAAAPAVEPTPVEPAPVEPAPVEPASAVESEPASDVLAEPVAFEPVAFERTPLPEPAEFELAPVAEPALVVDVVAERVFEPFAEPASTPEMPTIEAITPTPVLPDVVPVSDVAEPSANGKPNRGMGFFAR